MEREKNGDLSFAAQMVTMTKAELAEDRSQKFHLDR